MSLDLSIGSLFDVKGKTALVTGGGSGIGYMISAALINNGADVIIASRKEKALQEAAETLTRQGPGKASYIVADISSKAGCDALVSEVKNRVSKLHILVNNSGVTWGAPFNDFPEKGGWDRVLAANVKAPFYVTAGLADLLAKDSNNTDPGRVIIISSVAGISPRAEGGGLAAEGTGTWSYVASKAAANHLTQSLSITLGPRYITVNAICPGVFPSRMTTYGLKTSGEQMAASYPMKRFGNTQDMAGVALFLCSKASAHVSGLLLAVDGGSTIAGRQAKL
ncbi:rhamnolipids biosynthesis 3-oxoacyl-reductase [Atractiella rhizophila]|nr:rhamnolipids biosynthesis 3-oxoacyl-reductase [Atractiella rhizophila]